MDLATLLGLIGGFAFVIMAMVLGGSIGMFVDVTSILIVVGGSIFVVLMKFTMG
ncbi:flagellar motor protein PomA, partial [Vibrio alginolyticus]